MRKNAIQSKGNGLRQTDADRLSPFHNLNQYLIIIIVT